MRAGREGRGLLGLVSGNTPEARGRVLDLLLRASPDALVLSVSIHGDEAGRYPFVQRFAASGDERQRASLSQAATGDPAVILRQDLRAIARTDTGAHVVLALPGNVDAAAFLAELWRTPLGRSPLSDHYDLAPIAVGLDPGRLLGDLACVHRAVHVFGDRPHTVPLTVAEAAAQHVKAAQVVALTEGRRQDDGRGEGSRALLAHLNPSATVLRDQGEDGGTASLMNLTRPDSGWAAADPEARLDVVARWTPPYWTTVNWLSEPNAGPACPIRCSARRHRARRAEPPVGPGSRPGPTGGVWISDEARIQGT
ncbi:hypothetical protein [Streptomyces sp. NPDC019937]|uniref:hypothetical protein n=1 Tax=Streptomyces sp. NPDC019937 TaxID=3154787 RepID=UPI0033C6660A